ncbi:glycosyltransferase family 4 protein [Marinitoga lauensis]|uniref:glycosyltransferase family 4 protein n=1 Tax=Marinitoga lauensis TaxID=2201189 RepID=UPI0010116F67|nr:glycosyltransferase family 4 protein [Marinitoga lauensis]
MKIITISYGYPSKENLYINGFIHQRLKGYNKIEKNEIIFLSIKENGMPLPDDYEYEGINVKHYYIKDAIEFIKKYDPDILLIHFYKYQYFNLIKTIKKPVIIWVHGYEALSWKRRLFNIFKGKSFIRYIYDNTIQLKKYREFIKYANSRDDIYFVFVSNWMKNIAFNDIGEIAKNYKVIPNYIDTDFFSFKEKMQNERKKILLIRNFNSKKYATDIAIKAIVELSKKFNKFNELEFTIVGKGVLWKRQTAKIKHFPNITLINKFLTHKEIKKLHDNNGIFLCPTRQDSQGVSMCEAMSSGLVPITSYNTAIPEFVNEDAGYLTRNYKEIANAIIEMYDNPEIFIEKSKNAAESIRKKANFKKTIKEEYELMKKLINSQEV